MLWLALAILTIVVVGALLRPLLRTENDAPPSRAEYDMVVYRDQLAEIDRQIEEGMLAPDLADAARAEVHRRMLAAEDAGRTDGASSAGEGRHRQLLAVALVALLVPVGAAAVYGVLGSPKLPGQPYTWRVEHDPTLAAATSADALAAQVNGNPSAEGYRKLADTYFRAGNFQQSAAADRRAIDLGADDAAIWSAYGEAIAMGAGGIIVPEAMLAFTRALTRDAQDQRARFYVGLAEAQIGKLRYAVAIWRDLLASAPRDASWADLVRSHIAAISKQGGFAPESITPGPPDIAKLNAAVANMSTALQAAGANASPPPSAPSGPGLPADTPENTMIRGMVARLAERMNQNPNDVDGWRRLAHAYVVLGEPQQAGAAIAHAVKLKPNDAAVLIGLAEAQQAAARPGDDTPADFIATLRKLLTLQPENLQALYYVGLAEQKAGHEAAARAMWTKALSGTNNPADPLMIAIRNRLSGSSASR